MFYGRLLWQPKDRVPSGMKMVFRVGLMTVSALVAIAACSRHSTAAHVPMPVPTPSVLSTVSVPSPVAGSTADEVTASPSAPSPAVSTQGAAERPPGSSPTNAGSQSPASGRRVVARPHATPQPSARQIPPLPLPSLKPLAPAGPIWSSSTNIAWPPGWSPQGKSLVLQECTPGTCGGPAPMATGTPGTSAGG